MGDPNNDRHQPNFTSLQPTTFSFKKDVKKKKQAAYELHSKLKRKMYLIIWYVWKTDLKIYICFLVSCWTHIVPGDNEEVWKKEREKTVLYYIFSWPCFRQRNTKIPPHVQVYGKTLSLVLALHTTSTQTTFIWIKEEEEKYLQKYHRKKVHKTRSSRR